MDVNKELKNGVYVNLDSLIDTKANLLFELDVEVYKKELSNRRYHKRFSDQFDYIPNDIFTEIYRRRDKRVLKNPAPTYVLNLIKDYCIGARHSNIESGASGDITIHVNTFPYDLSENEIELLKTGIFSSMESMIDSIFIKIEMINKSDLELTPKWLGEEIGLAVMSNAMVWVNTQMQAGSLLSYPIPDIPIMTPTIVEEKLVIKKSSILEFFKEISQSQGMFVDIQFIRTEVFSIAI